MTRSSRASLNFATFVGLRYTFSRKRSRFTALISTISMLGMVLGVASLITVLSIMNGFAGELRGRILALVPHGFVEARDAGLRDWQPVAQSLLALPDVEAVSPYLTEKVILGSPRVLQGAVLTAIDPAREREVSKIAASITTGDLEALNSSGFNVLLGATLARVLNVTVGDTVEATIPMLTVTPLGVFPRSKRLTVAGVFEVGAQPDAYQAYVSLHSGQRLYARQGRVDGFQVRTSDLYTAPATLARIGQALGDEYLVKSWSQTQGSLFRAVKMEKLMVSLLLLSVVAVAAFNIVSTLVMAVTEKRRDIAVLRTMGVRPIGVMLIFVAHGLVLACAGVGAGALLGVLLASNVASLIAGIENVLGVKLFDPAVYFISELPASLQWSDVGAVVVAALGLSLLATLYPAWRAARIAPAEVLRYE